MSTVSATSYPVVVGVDGSACGMGALRWAADEAGRRGAPLRLVYAGVSAGPLSYEPADRMMAEAVAAAACWQSGISISSFVYDGPPADELCTESRRAELLVLGNRGRGDIEGMLLGSVSTQVAMHAQCPVLVVRDGQRWAAPETSLPSGHPVVVGVDGSPAADLAAGLAFQEAELRGCPLIAVRAWQPPGRPWRSDVRPLVLDVDELETAERGLLADSVSPWRKRHPDVPVRLRLSPGSPSAALLGAARQAELVVVGTRGHGELSSLLLGSTSHRILHHAACPVLLARESRRARPVPNGREAPHERTFGR